MGSKEYNKCFICGGQLEYFLTGKDLLYSVDNKKFDLYSCDNCNLKMIIPPTSQKELDYYYPKNYYSYSERGKTSFLKKIKFALINVSYRDKLSPISVFLIMLNKLINTEMFFGIPLKMFEKGKFLDIGCGDGEIVEIMQKNGWEAYGYETGEEKKEGKIFKSNDFTQVIFNNIKFDCIRIWHVFEHINNPQEYLRHISSLLNSDGIIYMGLPNTDSINAKIFQKYWFGYDMPRHQINYNLDNIQKLLNKFDLKIIRCNYSGNMFFPSLSFYAKYKFGLNAKFPLAFPILAHLFYKKDCLTLLIKKY